MAFENTSLVTIRRDGDDAIRELHHPFDPFTDPEAAGPPSLAERYLSVIDGKFDLGLGSLSGPTRLRLAAKNAVKTTLDSTLVTFDQIHGDGEGVRIDGAGAAVRIDARSGVTGFQNSVDYGVREIRAAFAEVTVELLSGLLGLQVPAAASRRVVENGPRINRQNPLIYRFERQERLASPANSPLSEPPPPPPWIIEGQYYLISEVFFTLASESDEETHWRLLLGRNGPLEWGVLRLERLCSCFDCLIFEQDPVSASGEALNAASDEADLSKWAGSVQLQTRMPLTGEYVEVMHTLGENCECAQPKSKDCHAANAFYHCERIFKTIGGLGFDLHTYFDGTCFPVPVRLIEETNAFACGNATGEGLGILLFGTYPASTMGMATNPRLVWHEIGHAVLHDQLHRGCLGFAHSMGDSLAAIAEAPDNKAPWDQTFPFGTATSETFGRNHNGKIRCGWSWARTDFGIRSEQILSTTLYRAYRALGGDSRFLDRRMKASRYLLRLILQAVALIRWSKRVEPFADALMESDLSTSSFEGRPGGVAHKILRWSFEKQGLYLPDGAGQFSEGAPPDIDVFIEDGRHGVYLPFFDAAPDSQWIHNRHSDDGGMTHETPAAGRTNYLRVQVSNRGVSTAQGITLRGFHSVNPTPVWPRDWTEFGQTVQVADLPSDYTTMARLAWTPPPGVRHVMASVSAPGDPSVLDGYDRRRGDLEDYFLVSIDNNVAQRTVG